MPEWTYAQQDPSDELCHLQYFSVRKRQAEGDIEFVITVREYVTPVYPGMRFLAQADKATNQNTAPYVPTGFGPSLLEALSECIKAIRKFPYEPPPVKP
ncbi:MAG: hypothetical protein M3Z32_12560 [Acidobacteriota bacterium]|nr:hypothetical protein [Acidobacteriota bacterium]